MPPTPNVQLGKVKKTRPGCVCVSAAARQSDSIECEVCHIPGMLGIMQISVLLLPSGLRHLIFPSLSLSLPISPHCLILIHTQHTPPDEL